MPAKPAPVCSITVGDIRVTYLPDGEGRVSATAVFPASNEALWASHAEYLDENNKLVIGIGGFLIETGDRKVVVDLGFGDMDVPFPPVDGFFRGGRFLDSLRQTGVQPEEVDTVFYTHLHLDHVGWTTMAGSLTFPNARHVAGAGEWDFWRAVTDENLAALGPHPEAVQRPLESRLDSVDDGATLAGGVTVVATPGHTPGHCSLVISSGNDRAILLGDSVHCPLQFDHGELSVIFDVDPVLARTTREKIGAELEGQPHTIAADGHFANATFGRLMSGAGKRWIPIA